eukprot:g3183.t1
MENDWVRRRYFMSHIFDKSKDSLRFDDELASSSAMQNRCACPVILVRHKRKYKGRHDMPAVPVLCFEKFEILRENVDPIDQYASKHTAIDYMLIVRIEVRSKNDSKEEQFVTVAAIQPVDERIRHSVRNYESGKKAQQMLSKNAMEILKELQKNDACRGLVVVAERALTCEDDDYDFGHWIRTRAQNRAFLVDDTLQIVCSEEEKEKIEYFTDEKKPKFIPLVVKYDRALHTAIVSRLPCRQRQATQNTGLGMYLSNLNVLQRILLFVLKIERDEKTGARRSTGACRCACTLLYALTSLSMPGRPHRICSTTSLHNRCEIEVVPTDIPKRLNEQSGKLWDLRQGLRHGLRARYRIEGRKAISFPKKESQASQLACVKIKTFSDMNAHGRKDSHRIELDKLSVKGKHAVKMNKEALSATGMLQGPPRLAVHHSVGVGFARTKSNPEKRRRLLATESESISSKLHRNRSA